MSKGGAQEDASGPAPDHVSGGARGDGPGAASSGQHRRPDQAAPPGRSGQGISTSRKRTDASDEALMMSVQGGDLTGLQELMLRYERALYGFLARYTGDGHLAEDLFQDCFLRLVQKRDSFDPGRGFRPWLYSIAANLARDACRRREVRSRETNRERLASKETVPRPDEEAERLEEAEIVGEVVADLPGDARAMVLLHFYQGLTYREVAAALDTPVGTVKSRMHWAVQKLARMWNERAASALASGSAAKGRG